MIKSTEFLITGYPGFVSQHFLNFLDNKNEKISVVCITRSPVKDLQLTFKNISVIVEIGDLNDRLKIQDILSHYRPRFILHLAAYSSVAYSWRYPIESFYNNTNIFLNLLEGIRILQLPCRLLSVGSSEEYGIVDKEQIPLKESSNLNPISPYAVARVSQELLSKIYVESYGLDIVLTRSFNHFGANQSDNFVIASLAKQATLNKISNIKTISVGNLEIIRDFIDVRDVVNAYYLLFFSGKKGEIYNVCSGKGHSIYQILDYMNNILGIEMHFEINQSLLRKNDNPTIIGDNTKIINDTGWALKYTLEDSLRDILEYWKNKLEK